MATVDRPTVLLVQRAQDRLEQLLLDVWGTVLVDMTQRNLSSKQHAQHLRVKTVKRHKVRSLENQEAHCDTVQQV